MATLLGCRVVLEPLRGDGVLNGRAVLFSHGPRGRVIEQHAYHHWLSIPGRMIQDYLVAALRASGMSGDVRAGGPAEPADYRLSGRLLRLEQVHDRGGSGVAAALQLELRAIEQDEPLVAAEYSARRATASRAVADAIPAFENALGEIVERFVADVGLASASKGHAQPSRSDRRAARDRR